MTGQGRPRTSSRYTATCAWLVALVGLCAPTFLHAEGLKPANLEPTLQLRIAWGGGAERLWRGEFRLTNGTLAEPRPLGIEADEPGSMWIDEGRLFVDSHSLRAYDGVDVSIFAPLDAGLQILLWPAESPRPEKPIEIALSELVSSHHNSSLDDRNNRLLVRRAPGDALRVRLPKERTSLIFNPGETFRLDLLPRQLGTSGAKVRFDLQLSSTKGGAASWKEERELAVDDEAPPSVPLEIRLPDTEGSYDLSIVARTRSRLRLWQTVAERKVQVVVLAANVPPAPLVGEKAWVKLAEIDPAEPLNPAWWNRFAQIAVLPGFRNKEPLGTGEASPWQHPQLGEKLIQLGPGGREPNISWEAYPLPIDKPGEPHVLEIDYPSDVPQFLGISIVEPNSAGAVLPVGLDSGVYVPDEAAQEAPRLEKHRLIFYPRTRSPLVLLTNRRDGSRAVYGRIRLYGGQGRLPRAFPREEAPERLWAAFMDRPLFPENFSAPDSLDNWSGRSLDDWTTFHEGALRCVDYLNHIGLNGLMLPVLADGSSLYPSRLLEPTPRYDTGIFFGSGQDPLRKDILELLLRTFDRERLGLVPMLQFAAPLPELEALLRSGGADSVGIEWVGPSGRSWREVHPASRGKAPYYNPLHPRVQAAMLAVVRELVDRYGPHASFVGLSLDLSADGYALLPGAEWGLDDTTIAAFQRAHPKLRVPGVGPARFADRARYLSGEQRVAWTSWRTEELQKFFQSLQAELTRAQPSAKLYLAGANMFSSPTSQQALRPQLPRRTRMEQLLIELGVPPPGEPVETPWTLLRPQRFSSRNVLDGATLEINQAAELDRLAEATGSGVLFYHEPQEARLESFDAKSPFKRTYTWLLAQGVPSGQENRRRFVRALAAYDARQMFDGGAMLPMGQESAIAGILATYRRLPAEQFATLEECPQPLTLRTLSRGDETWFYAVNDSPWNITVSIPVSLPMSARLRPLDAHRSSPQLLQDVRGVFVNIQLEPYDFAGGTFSAANVLLGRPSVELPPGAVDHLKARMNDLANRQRALAYPAPLEGWPKNNQFEAASEAGGSIAAWSFPGTSATIDTRQKHGDLQSVCLQRGPHDREAWLRSEAIPPPRTGRLSIGAWLRVADVRRQPALRLAVEWQAEGQVHYRYAALGQPQFGEKEEVIPDRWKWYIFSVTDLPSAGVSELRVRLDLMSEGKVWVDDVQLYDLRFDPDTEQIELIKMIWHYTNRLQEGQVGDCLQFLESYWPRYLTANVALINNPTTAATGPRTAVQPNRPAPPAKEEKKPGFFDRLKEYAPSRSWF